MGFVTNDCGPPDWTESLTATATSHTDVWPDCDQSDDVDGDNDAKYDEKLPLTSDELPECDVALLEIYQVLHKKETIQSA